jgi:hypothetical protein
MFDLRPNPDGTVNILNVPIFKTHQDRRYNCDEAWLDRCVADFMGQKLESLELAEGDARYAMLPSVTVGHTPEDPNAPEPLCEGFLDNVRRVGRLLYADLMHVSRDAWGKIKDGKLPYRSAEVIPSKHRITNLSLLGGRYPHFALPVMRFRSRAHGEVIRYTFATKDNTAMDENAILQLAQHLAPMVADIIANKQADAADADMSTAGTADDGQGSDTGQDGPGGPDDAGFGEEPEEPQPYRNRERAMRTTKQNNTSTRTARVERHGEAAVTANGKRGNAFATNEFSTNTEGNEAPMTGPDLGTSNPARHAEQSARAAYSALQRENEALRGQLQRLNQSVGELQRHKVSEAQAAKRIMLRSKCREIAALGYAIGDGDRIERHVDRMMGLGADDVRAYIDDVLKGAPKVAMQATRYGSHDIVRRPGADEDEAEKYASENADSMRRLGLDADILRLADVLEG